MEGTGERLVAAFPQMRERRGADRASGAPARRPRASVSGAPTETLGPTRKQQSAAIARSLIRAVIAHQADAVMADHHDPAIGNLDSIAGLRA
jgi:hypothetical protein